MIGTQDPSEKHFRYFRRRMVRPPIKITGVLELHDDESRRPTAFLPSITAIKFISNLG